MVISIYGRGDYSDSRLKPIQHNNKREINKEI